MLTQLGRQWIDVMTRPPFALEAELRGRHAGFTVGSPRQVSSSRGKTADERG